MKNIVLSLLFFSLILPLTAQTKAEKKKIKKEKAIEEYASLKEFINTGVLNFEAEWATTNTGRRINLIGNSNFLKIDNKNGDIYLPFFGTAHSASVGFDGNGGIVYKGELENYTVNFNDKKQRVTMTFSAKEKSETFDFILTLYGNKTGNLTISSNSRSNMSYSGALK